jgi:hypothetical protein
MEFKDVASLSISCIALVVSVVAAYVNRRQWRIINRPFVVVRLINPKAGNAGTCYELKVENIGTRPATDIRLKTDIQKLRAGLAPSSNCFKDSIEACFADSTVIGLLTPGESVVSAFGYNGIDEQTWIIGHILPIQVTYKDLQHQEFKTEGSIIINTRNGFTGQTWGD